MALLVGLLTTSLSSSVAWSKDTQAETLSLIADTADRICNVVKAEGSSTNSSVSGSIKAELSGLASKLASAGISGAGTLNQGTYQGVLRQDLKQVLADNAACKLKVFDALQDKLLRGATRNTKTTVNVGIKTGRPIVSYDHGWGVDLGQCRDVDSLGRDVFVKGSMIAGSDRCVPTQDRLD